MKIAEIIGIEEAVRLVCIELKKFAAHGKLPRVDGQWENVRQVGNVHIWFSPKDVGVARFFFVTADNVQADIEIDFGSFTREYLDDTINMLREKINEHRGKRSPTVVNATSMVDTTTSVRGAVAQAINTLH